MIKFSAPKNGWLCITLVDDEDEKRYSFIYASYLTDVPGDMLNAAIVSLEYGLPFSIEIDGEDRGYYVLTNAPYAGDLFLTNYEESFVINSINAKELAKQVLNFIEENLEDVYGWLAYEDEPEENEEYKESIDKKVAKLKTLLEKE